MVPLHKIEIARLVVVDAGQSIDHPDFDPVGRFDHFSHLTDLVRCAQRLYFTTRDRDDLRRSKRLEVRLDDVLSELRNPFKQGRIF